MPRDLLNVPDECYRRVFQEDADGSAILDDLARRFYDVPCYVPGQPVEDAVYRDGARQVVLYILQRAGTQVQGG